MLIWGTKSVKRRLDTGHFHCPRCGGQRSYSHMRAQAHGHIYWIPLFATGEPVEYLECHACLGTYDPALLDRQPLDEAAFRSGLGAAMLATMVAVAAADGQVDDAEIDVIHGLVPRVMGQGIDREAIARIAAEPGAGDLATASHMLAKLAPNLNSEGKEMVVKAVVFTAMADGAFGEEEIDRVMQVAVALGVSQAHLKGILAEVGRAPVQA